MRGAPSGGRTVATAARRSGLSSAIAIALRITVLLIAAPLAACGTTEPTPSAETPEPPVSAAARDRWPLSRPDAFALWAGGDGALLVLGGQGGVRAIRLDPSGHAVGDPVIIHDGPSAEVVAHGRGRRVGVAWVQAGEPPETWSAFSPNGGARFSPGEAVAPTVDTGSGRLAMAVDDAGVLALYHRIPPAPCVASDGVCARFDRHPVGGRDVQGARRGTEPLEVREPCDPLIGDALHSAGSWYYGVCSGSTEPTAKLFVVRPEPMYAAAMDLPAGCRPGPLAPMPGGALAFVDCDGRRLAVPVDGMARLGPELEATPNPIRCEDGRPVLSLGPATLAVTAAESRLAPLVPDELAGRGSRAVWTGEALLVATPEDGEVHVTRHRCEGAELVSF